ncbi:Ferredoxin reductase (plasmid) [Cupriavidus necator H850]|uniref:patatin-like phospholipase family protein n=1 Tax=Cupriavidus necator TaxID=106590 RepID=UPI00129E2A1E|nr:patatin-like phospholipase family protein [Cupriavidus necator]KAI3604940.1 Ferredoxin reductase [Cupriavidus necator H850]
MKNELFPYTRCERIALVLQGGGALGAYQAGAYEALVELRYPPNWVAGVSIGAINAAVIAGNPPARRIERLHDFWELASSGLGEIPPPPFEALRGDFNRASAVRAVFYGVPGLFTPRTSLELSMAGLADVLSVYDASPLRATLERLVDFDRINAREIRFSVGAVNVGTGNSMYFDNSRHTIRAEHVLASSALPPWLPPVEIDGVLYWDGGIVSNTPLQYVLDDKPRANTLVFQADLFSARGAVPSDLLGVMKRHKEIVLSSRTRYNTDSEVTSKQLTQEIDRLVAKLPAKLQEDAVVRQLRKLCSTPTIDIVHLIYHGNAAERVSIDYEFSRASIEERWRTGYADVMRINEHRDWFVDSSPELGVRVYDVHLPEKRTGAEHELRTANR